MARKRSAKPAGAPSKAGRRRTFVFDHAELVAAIKSSDELTSEIAKLIGRFGDDRVAKIVTDLGARLWKPKTEPRKTAGRKTKWGNDGKLYAWIAIEAQWRADRAAAPKTTLTQSVMRRLKKLGRWRVLYDGVNGRHLDIIDAGTARKYHGDGARLIREMPEARQKHWSDIVDTQASLIRRRLGTK